MPRQHGIKAFLAGDRFAVVGASRDRAKYGNKVLRAYQMADMEVYPVNPQADEIEGLKCYPDLASLPKPVHGISVITPPAVTETIIEQAAAQGIHHVWLQPGAESPSAVEKGEALGLNLIADGSCFLVVSGYHE